MKKTTPTRPSIDPSRISNPIALLAYLGILVEGVVGIIAYHSADKPVFSFLATGLILLPVLLGLLIYRLITVHYSKLYSPSQYPNPDDFLKIVQLTSQTLSTLGRESPSNIFRPLGHDRPVDSAKASLVRPDIAVVEAFLQSVHAGEFLIFHSWFNQTGRHDLALICIDIAVAKGAATAQNCSFRSASLRKLGRVQEAIHSATIALELEPDNPDALYNLARSYIALGRNSDAKRVLEVLQKNHATAYALRLMPFMPATGGPGGSGIAA